MSDWQLGPFARHSGAILEPDATLSFRCPVSGRDVAWAAKDVFNPGAVTRDGRVHLLVRAEDTVGRYAGTSRIGLATSDDGQALFDRDDPRAVIARPAAPFLAEELTRGQVDNVCFAQGLVHFDRRWLLYYGMADSRIGCAEADELGNSG